VAAVDATYPDRTDSQSLVEFSSLLGNYRLAVELPAALGATVSVTDCIPYHASAAVLEVSGLAGVDGWSGGGGEGLWHPLMRSLRPR
jgi:hypothetical protein